MFFHELRNWEGGISVNQREVGILKTGARNCRGLAFAHNFSTEITHVIGYMKTGGLQMTTTAQGATELIGEKPRVVINALSQRRASLPKMMSKNWRLGSVKESYKDGSDFMKYWLMLRKNKGPQQ